MVTDPLTEAAAALCRQHPGLDPARAYQLALQDDPSAYVHNTPEGSEGHVGDRQVSAAHPGASPGGGLPAAGQRHFRELSAAERAREPLMRRLRPGEPLGERTGIHKLGTDAGSGMFVLEDGR